jgi:hypothetical protein
MATGSSPLTVDSLRLATRDSSQAAIALLGDSRDLEATILQYQQGELSQPEFEEAVRQKISQIRGYAKKIRRDPLLDYIDVREDRRVIEASEAGSIPELLQLAQQLQLLAGQLQETFDEYSRENLATKVTVDHLERPSVDSLSKGIDQVAKVIKKSTARL